MKTAKQAKELLESLRPMQENPVDASLPPLQCPRCGRHSMNGNAMRNAKSRRANVYICGECGQDEAMRDAAGLPPLPVTEWSMVRAFG